MEILNENEGAGNSSFATLREPRWSPPPPKRSLCMANTTLMVLRLLGRYSHLMKLLHPIADDILLGMKHLFQYYIYSVDKFFRPDLQEVEASLYSEHLIKYLQEIECNVLLNRSVVSQVDEQGNQIFKVFCLLLLSLTGLSMTIDISKYIFLLFLAKFFTLLLRLEWICPELLFHTPQMDDYLFSKLD